MMRTSRSFVATVWQSLNYGATGFSHLGESSVPTPRPLGRVGESMIHFVQIEEEQIELHWFIGMRTADKI